MILEKWDKEGTGYDVTFTGAQTWNVLQVLSLAFYLRHYCF